MPGPEHRGHWRHDALFGINVPAHRQLSLGEGDSPLEEAPLLTRDLGLARLRLKREDLAPAGSHKGRSLSLLVSTLTREQAVISSSGNAALAASEYCALAGVRLLTVVSPRTPLAKLTRLAKGDATVVASSRPVALLHHAVDAWGMADLRSSTSRLGSAAYRGIAAELSEAGSPGAIFQFSSSGATLLGIAEGLGALGLGPSPIHPVEALPGGEITRPWYRGGARGEQATPGQPAIGELGTRRSRLAPALRREVRRSGGRGWRVGWPEVLELRELAEARGVRTSWEGIAALAAARAWARSLSGPASGDASATVILTGAAWQLDMEPAPPGDLPVPLVDTEADLDRLLRAAEFAKEGG